MEQLVVRHGNMKTINAMIALVAVVGCATSPLPVTNSRPIPTQRIMHLPVVSQRERAAKVTIVRDTGFPGSMYSVVVRLNGRRLAAFETGESLAFSVDPGDYVLAVELQPGLREYSLTANASQHYFYRISVVAEGPILQRSYEINR
jgi:hypothetical protein